VGLLLFQAVRLQISQTICLVWSGGEHLGLREARSLKATNTTKALLGGAKYLLYLDILGFRELAKRDIRKVHRLYGVIDSLNVHNHYFFKTIVFSDTILVYNSGEPKSVEDHDYTVWYAIEFAEDLHHRLTGLDIYFRGILTYGNFNHYSLKNIECFFGQTLIDAYEREKQIPSIGLFVDDRCNVHNRYFRTERFSEDLNFVYLCRDIEGLYKLTAGDFPLPSLLLEDDFPYLVWQITFLRSVWLNMRNHKDPKVRTKFLTTWDFYARRYPILLNRLESSKFDPTFISPEFNWTGRNNLMMRDIAYFRALGRRQQSR
jgi:hypothetical protein